MEHVSKHNDKTVWIHWVSALLIFGLIYTGINMEHGAHDESKFLLYRIHFALGFTVFILTIIRIILLFTSPRPAPLYPEKLSKERFRRFVYNSFYIVLLWMCISGMLSLSLEGIMPALQSGNFVDLPVISADGFHPIMLSHHIVAKLVFLLLIFHIGGFIIHLIQTNENTLRRIWFG